MEQTENKILEELGALNPCVQFVLDNYDMLCIAHPDKVVMTMNSNKLFVDMTEGPVAYVAKVFDSMIEAMSYTRAVDMGHVPYALVKCDGYDIARNLLWSVGCRKQN